jgi:hypothetical protein
MHTFQERKGTLKERNLGRITCETQEVSGLVERGCWWTDMITPLCVQFLAIKSGNACNQRIGLKGNIHKSSEK